VEVPVVLISLIYFDGAFQCCFRISKEGQRHAVTGRKPDQFAHCFGLFELRRLADDLIQLV
jgi:hypothetical protein